MKLSKIFIFVVAFTAIILTSCGITQVPDGANAKQTYEFAMKQFNDENYESAQLGFDRIKLQYPASIYADDAQFNLAEINYNKSQYILAAFNYNSLRRVYPQSEHAQESLFKTAMSYYKLSPKYDRDQEYTYKAIKAFSEFQAVYPNDSLYYEADKVMSELRNKLAYREFFTAELYRKIRSSKSSLVYYQSVIDDFADSDYFDDAIVGKIETLEFLGKYSEALRAIKKYNSLYPDGEFKEKVKNIKALIGKKKK